MGLVNQIVEFNEMFMLFTVMGIVCFFFKGATNNDAVEIS